MEDQQKKEFLKKKPFDQWLQSITRNGQVYLEQKQVLRQLGQLYLGQPTEQNNTRYQLQYLLVAQLKQKCDGIANESLKHRSI